MRRSFINENLRWAEKLLKENNISLPDFAFWSPEQWKANKDRVGTIRKVYLGWDIKEFSQELGAVLFTLRNGRYDDDSVGVPYCEKVILFHDGKRLPIHYHKTKTEDIINRAGGIMRLRLFNTKDGELDTESEVKVYQDGILHIYKPGEIIDILPGNSITLPPFLAHTFGPAPGSDVIAGEVSKINDDFTDNYRFEKIITGEKTEEDEPMLYPLCTEYEALFA